MVPENIHGNLQCCQTFQAIKKPRTKQRDCRVNQTDCEEEEGISRESPTALKKEEEEGITLIVTFIWKEIKLSGSYRTK